MPGLLASLGLAVVAVLVIWKGSERFEGAAERLSRHYGLPVAVHGATVVAVGSRFPEISSIVISTLFHGEFFLGVGAIAGSAIFTFLVAIPTMVFSRSRHSSSSCSRGPSSNSPTAKRTASSRCTACSAAGWSSNRRASSRPSGGI